MPDINASRVKVVYSGNVQGVGFRMTALGLARPLPIVGWVRNEPNGDVLLEAQGERTAVETLLSRLAREMRDNIEGSDIQWGPATGAEQTFEVRY